ncbi:hypothetical protein [Marinilabilia rubra]|nr:hypothetical protein [Marinilabilia rubra]
MKNMPEDNGDINQFSKEKNGSFKKNNAIGHGKDDCIFTVIACFVAGFISTLKKGIKRPGIKPKQPGNSG